MLRNLCCVSFCCLIVAGCASSHQVTELPDPRDTVPKNGLARIYVIHKHSRGQFAVADGNKLIGEAGVGCFVGWEREAGPATIITGALVRRNRGANPFASIEDSSLTYDYKGSPHTFLTPVSRNLKVEPGKIYYVLLDWSWSTSSFTIDFADEKTGKALLEKSNKPRVKIQEKG